MFPGNRFTGRFIPINDRVYLWRISSLQPQFIVDHLTELLSQSERKRAENFHFASDQRRFIVRRGLLRIILGMVLGLPPEDFFLSYSTYGKPFIALDSEINFNLSSSGEFAVIAIAKNREIGVDIERKIPLSDMQQIAKHYFSPNEYVQWQKGEDHQQIDMFYRLWTCKEALVKALGVGLSLPLENIDITFNADSIPHLAFKDWSRETSQWGLFPLDITPGYSACLAADLRKYPLVGRYENPFHQVSLQMANHAVEVALAEVI